MNNLYLLLIFILLTVVFFFTPATIGVGSATIFLTVATFIFAILAGFFIARQSNRYNSIRGTIATFDGNISALFRSFGALDKKAQNKAGKIIKEHYKKILKTGKWDYHFTHKSTTIKELGALLIKTGGKKRYPSVQNETINNMVTSLDNLQTSRKMMVGLHIERMPTGGWILVIFLALLLLVSLLLIPNDSIFIGSLMKGFFGALIVQVVFLLYELDSLKSFESNIGETSAKDIIQIIEGKR